MSKQTPELSASNLKALIWDTLQDVRNGSITTEAANSISTLTREALRVVRTQLAVATQTKRDVPIEVIKFSEK